MLRTRTHASQTTYTCAQTPDLCTSDRDDDDNDDDDDDDVLYLFLYSGNNGGDVARDVSVCVWFCASRRANKMRRTRADNFACTYETARRECLYVMYLYNNKNYASASHIAALVHSLAVMKCCGTLAHLENHAQRPNERARNIINVDTQA